MQDKRKLRVEARVDNPDAVAVRSCHLELDPLDPSLVQVTVKLVVSAVPMVSLLPAGGRDDAMPFEPRRPTAPKRTCRPMA